MEALIGVAVAFVLYALWSIASALEGIEDALKAHTPTRTKKTRPRAS